MRPLATLVLGWNKFWFTQQSTASVELFRIAYGVLVTAWMLTMIPVLEPFYGPGAAVPPAAFGPGTWTVLTFVQGSHAVWLVWFTGLAAAVALMLGYGTRLAAVLVFVVLVSLIRQAPLAFNYGDALVRILAFYMIFMPAGSAAALDRRRADPGKTWVFPRRTVWALRLAQIQLSVLYLSAVWDKSGGSLWRDGTAVAYALRIGNVSRFTPPDALSDSVVLMQLATFGTLAVEASIGILVWNRTARPYVLAIGVLLHLSIDLSMMTGFFSPAMLVLYLVFVPPQRAEQVFDLLRTRAATLASRLRMAPIGVRSDPAESLIHDEASPHTVESIRTSCAHRDLDNPLEDHENVR